MRNDKHREAGEVDKAIMRIVEMDKRAQEIRNNTTAMLEKMRSNLDRDIALIEKDELERAKDEGRKAYEGLVEEGQREAKRIEGKTDRVCEELEKAFSKIHKGLEQDILGRVLTKDTKDNA
jgi:hypothetical protein